MVYCAALIDFVVFYNCVVRIGCGDKARTLDQIHGLDKFLAQQFDPFVHPVIVQEITLTGSM